MFKVVKWAADERVDLDDQEQATGVLDIWETIRHNRTLHMPEGRNTGTAPTEARFLSGFNIDLVNDASVGGNGYCRLNRGSGFFKLTREGETRLGLLVGDEGDASMTLDFTGEAVGVNHAVWIRAIYQDSDNENRVFWNSGASAEYVDYVATREEVIWEYDIRTWAAPSPGDDWVKAWLVPVAAGPVIGTIVDYRHFYFEGDAAGSYAQEWGTGNDRLADRSTYGVQDFHDFCSAVRAKVAEIQGTTGWWTAPTVDLVDMAVEHKNGGNHSDVVADSLSTHRVNVAQTGVSPEGVLLDATGRLIGETGPLSMEDWDGNTQVYVMDASGRPARGHPFVDDFVTYKNWTAKAAGVPQPYTIVAVGSADTYCSVSSKFATVPAMARHGGVNVLETTANGNDEVQVRGPNAHYLNASNGIYLRAFFRAALDGNAPTTRIDHVGLAESGGGKQFYFRRAQSVYGDGNWRFYVDDGVAVQNIDLGVAPTANVYQNFYIGFISNTQIHVWITGMLGATTVVIASLFGAADIVQTYWHTDNNAVATAHFFCVDHAEVWDMTAVHGGVGAQAS